LTRLEPSSTLRQSSRKKLFVITSLHFPVTFLHSPFNRWSQAF